MSEIFKWGDYEEGILIEAIKEEGGNVKKGLEKAADILNTSFYICRNRWYKHIQQKLLEKEKAGAESKLQVVHEPEIVEHSDQGDEVVQGLKDSLEDFLGNLTRLVAENRRLTKENTELTRDNKLLVSENKELKESYEYILKVIDRARKLCLEDEDRPATVKYTIGKDGAIDISA